MKKIVAILVAVLFALSVTGLCFAQADKAAPAAPAVKAADDKAKAADDKAVKADKKAKKADKKAKKAKKDAKKAKKDAKEVEKKDDMKKDAAPAPAPVKK